MQGIVGGMERRTKLIADDLKDIASVRLDRLAQDLMVPCEKRRHGIWMLLGQLCAAFDVRK
jgi:hypothetical protein